MIINSVLSSTKDNSIQNNTHKKKLFLNSKFPNQNKNTNENDISKSNTLKQTPQKKKIILPNNTIYEGYIINNEFEGYGELRNPYYISDPDLFKIYQKSLPPPESYFYFPKGEEII